MQELEQFTAMVVKCAKEGFSMGVLRAQLLREGMSDEEMTLLLEIIALEVRYNPPSTAMVRARGVRQIPRPLVR